MHTWQQVETSICFLEAFKGPFGLAQIYVDYDPEPFGTQTRIWGKRGEGLELLHLLGQHSGSPELRPICHRAPLGQKTYCDLWRPE